MTEINAAHNGRKTDITVIFACHNRREKTKNCIHTLVSGNPACRFAFVAVDDGSTDGTGEMLRELKREHEIHILHGNGALFYSGGMRVGMNCVLERREAACDYVLLINDDVTFFDHAVEKMIRQSREQNDAVIAGAMCDDQGRLSYSAVKYTKGIRCRNLAVSEWEIPADTFCANGVLIPYHAFLNAPVMDERYVHAMGDFDYGMGLKRSGFVIHASREYAGNCNDNPKENTWADPSLGVWERIRKKETPGGLPAKQWFYYLRKNFGLFQAVLGSCTPYVRILLGRRKTAAECRRKS